ncbi:hypothetical protein J4417_03200 [Candidatus Woesearchaeota archaeon]|nr:hypothetical protein [Candidatus Woesearchaeota archaeon]
MMILFGVEINELDLAVLFLVISAIIFVEAIVVMVIVNYKLKKVNEIMKSQGGEQGPVI